MLRIKISTLKSLICIVVYMATVQVTFAQSYTHSPNDTIIANANYDDFNVYNIIQLHPTNDTLFFKWKKLNVTMPNTWEASICDVGHCYTSIVDSSSMDAVVTGDIGLISLHLNPHFQSGTGIVQVLFWEASTPTQIDTLTWIISTTPLVIENQNVKNNISIYPNPTTEILNISTPFENGFDYVLTNITGRIIYQNHSNSKNTFLQTSHFANGNYFLTVLNNKTIYHSSLKIHHY